MKGRISKVKLLGSLFWTFFKISPITFGGGYAMIPVIEREVAEKNKWLQKKEMSEIFSMSGSLPGGIGVNAAAFIGYRLAGIPGAIAAVSGISLPTFLIVEVLYVLLNQFQFNPKISAALQGIQAAVIALMITAAYRMGKSAVVDLSSLIMLISSVGILFLFQIHPMVIIILGMFEGHAVAWVKRKLGYRVPEASESAEKNEGSDSTANGYKYPDYFIADGI